MRSIQFVGLIIFFVVFSAVVVSGIFDGFDAAAIGYFKSIQGNPTLDAVMITITLLDDVITLFAFGVVISIIKRTRKIGLVFLVAVVVIAIIIMYIKPIVGRAVPPYSYTPALKLPDKFILESDSLAPPAVGFSYPSGFIARATALSFIVGFAINKQSRRAGLIMWSFPVVIAITKLYLMEHYPTDLVGGFILGLVVAIALSNLVKLDRSLLPRDNRGGRNKKQVTGDS